jgi:hypothetical protein
LKFLYFKSNLILFFYCSYKNKFKDFDGKRLHRLYDWKKKESQLYYNFVNETFESGNGQASKTTDILIFEEELEKLFS